MRSALRKVREQLGPEAVILTSKRMPFGVEVTAAIDFDAASIEAQAQKAESPEAPTPPSQPRKFQPEEFAPHAPRADEGDANVQLSPFARLQAEMLQATPVQARNGEAKAATSSQAHARTVQAGLADFDTLDVNEDVESALESAIDACLAGDGAGQGEDLAPATPARPNNRTASSSGTLDDESEESALSQELKAMRRILETQMAQLAWNDLSRRAPIHTEILRELTEVGLTQDFAAQIVAQLPAGTDLIKARRLSISLIAQRLNVTGDRWLDTGGHIALVGPTGVGKTTALAKLAVRWVLRHGARSLALISADAVRIGAHDQLQALGQMLDVPVCVAESFSEIPKALEPVSQKRLVLIDTPGISQRDPQLAERMAQLASSGNNVETALVLAASTQAGAIAETVARFSTAKVSSVLLTKVDEAASLGGILSVLARSELPISYVSEGQRVPEDLRPARTLELVSRAVQLAKTSGAAADEDLLRRRYGEVAHVLA
jgi:flagellar biosynthesis protein FlhF